MKDKLFKRLWKNYRSRILDIKGFDNCFIHNEKQFLDLFEEIYFAKKAELKIREMYNIYALVKKTALVEGDIVEVGVYKGGSSRIICEAKGERSLHLFDTFEGLPEVDDSIDTHSKGEFADTSLEAVRAYLNAYDNVNLYKGLFPESATEFLGNHQKLSFIHLDVDIYSSVRDCLNALYPRLNKGGVLLSHDYGAPSCPGVRKAFDEFFKDKPEPIIELFETQCLIIKM